MQAVYDPLVRLPVAGLAPPRTAYDAFAYDAVWATALGLAGSDRADRADLLGRIRAARFYGASCAVAFDSATGDRALAGLQVVVVLFDILVTFVIIIIIIIIMIIIVIIIIFTRVDGDRGGVVSRIIWIGKTSLAASERALEAGLG